jgi:hypothetical protein
MKNLIMYKKVVIFVAIAYWQLPVGFYFVAVALVSICEAYAGVSNSQQVKTPKQ